MYISKKSKYYLAAAVALATFFLYIPALQNDFVEWDDGPYVYDNPLIRALEVNLFKHAFFDFHASNWHPLTWISHAVDYSLWGLNPFGHHLTSVVLHAINSFLVVLLIAGLLDIAKERETAGSARTFPTRRSMLIIAGATGLLFGVHPVHVESAAWVAERKDVLCALFFLLSIMMYAKCMEHGAEGKKSLALTPCAMHHAVFVDRYYLAALGFFILALLSKPMAVTLPLVLLILDWHPLGRISSARLFRSALVEKLPFFALSLGSSILTLLAQRAGGALQPIEFAPFPVRVLVAAKSLVVYLGKIIWPRHLAPLYPYPKNVGFLSVENISTAVLLIAITIICFLVIKRQRVWFAVWAYYVVTLLPVIGIVQVGGQSMADRYLYLPGIGPFFIIGLAAGFGFEKTWSFPRKRLLAGAGILMIFAGLSFVTVKQIGIWKNSLVFWNYVLEKEPGAAYAAYKYRGVYFQRNGDFSRALEDYDAAIATNPGDYQAFLNRGTVFSKIGRFDRAIADFDQAISLNPAYYKAYNNRAYLYGEMGQTDKAMADFEKAITINPASLEAYLNLGVLYAKLGLTDEAIRLFSKSIAINPRSAEAYTNRGLAYFSTGRSDRALEDFGQAIALNQNNVVAYLNRSRIYLDAGLRDQGLLDLKKACEYGSENGCEQLAEMTR